MPRQSFYYNPNLPLQNSASSARSRSSTRPAGCPGGTASAQRDGVRLSFTNSTTSGDPLREQVQQFLQQTFAEIGVEMNISNLPAAVMWGEFWRQSHFDSVIVGSTYLIGADPDVTNRLHSRSIASKGRPRFEQCAIRQIRRSTLCSTKVAAPSIRKRGARSTSAYKNWSGMTCPFCRFIRALQCRGTRKGFKERVSNGNTRTESLERRRLVLGELIFAVAVLARESRWGGNVLNFSFSGGGPNARISAESPLTEPRAAGDRLDHRLHHSEPHSRRPPVAIRAGSEHDPAGYGAAGGTVGVEQAAMDPVFRLGMAPCAGRLGPLLPRRHIRAGGDRPACLCHATADGYLDGDRYRHRHLDRHPWRHPPLFAV